MGRKIRCPSSPHDGPGSNPGTAQGLRGATPVLRLAVVVITRARPGLLEKCLRSLEGARARAGAELAAAIYVEINGSDADNADTQAVCAKFGELVRAREVAPRVSPGEARNRALEVIQPESDWVLFVDDDAFVDPGYFLQFLAVLARHPEARVVGGPNLTPPQSSLFQRASGVALASRCATFFSSARYRARGVERTASEEDLILCNLFVHQAALKQPEFGGRPFPHDFLFGEENWLLLRLRESGAAMVYSPALHVWHERRAGWSGLARQVFRYGEGRARNLVERPHSLRVAHLIPSLCLLYAGFMAGIVAEYGWPPDANARSLTLIGLLPFAAYPLVCLLASFLSATRAPPLVNGDGKRELGMGNGRGTDSHPDASAGMVALSALVFPVIHVSYGLGLLGGLCAAISACGREKLRAGFALPAIWATTLWIYWPLIVADPVLERDDLRTLKNIRGFSAFRALVSQGEADKILIYQPVRDATLLFDQFLKRTLGFGTYHLTNWLLWCAIITVAFAILRRLLPNRQGLAVAAVALFAVHPVFVGSVGWLSARKHLLAAFFALAATDRILRFRDRGGSWWRTALTVLALYTLSMLSHPIAILWPLWAVYFARQLALEHARKRAGPNPVPRAPPYFWSVGLLGLPLAFIALVFSVRYYGGLYVAHTLNLKFVASPEASAPISLLAHGRYLFNLLIPFRLATVYYPGAVWNLAGLFAAPFVFAALLTGPRASEAKTWFAFYLFPLLPVTLVMTNVFVSDTYLLLPAFGLAVLLAQGLAGWLEPHERAPVRSLAMAALALVIIFAASARRETGAWASDRELWLHADRVEPSPRSLAMRIRLRLEAGDVAPTKELLARLHEWDPGNADYPQLFARAVYLDPELSAEAKVDLLSRADLTGPNAEHDPWFNYFFGATLARAGRYREADARYRFAEGHAETFEDELALVAAEGLKICNLGGAPDCQRRLDSLRGRIASQPVLRSHWDEAAFRRRSLELDRSLAAAAGPNGS